MYLGCTQLYAILRMMASDFMGGKDLDRTSCVVRVEEVQIFWGNYDLAICMRSKSIVAYLIQAAF